MQRLDNRRYCSWRPSQHSPIHCCSSSQQSRSNRYSTFSDLCITTVPIIAHMCAVHPTCAGIVRITGCGLEAITHAADFQAAAAASAAASAPGLAVVWLLRLLQLLNLQHGLPPKLTFPATLCPLPLSSVPCILPPPPLFHFITAPPPPSILQQRPCKFP